MSDKPQTTRHQIRGVLNRADAQIVFVDTPGIHKPRTLMGERLNDTATDGARRHRRRLPADRGQLADRSRATASSPNGCRPKSVLVLNKIDRADARADHGAAGRGLGAGLRRVLPDLGPHRRGCRRPGGVPVVPAARRPALVPRRTRSATCPSRSWWPSWCASSCWRSPARSCRTRSPPGSTEWEWPRIRVEILVERDSQKGIVIGKGGAVLKEVGTRVRAPAARGCVPRAARHRRQGLAVARPRRWSVWATEPVGYRAAVELERARPDADPRPRGHRHGRQRSLGPASGPAPHRRPRRGRGSPDGHDLGRAATRASAG